MNFLILINSAPDYKYFYYELGKEIERRGHTVFYAVDSHRSKYLEPLKELDENINTFFFDVFLEKNFNKDLSFDKSFNDGSFWGDYFYSDYDRFLTHDFNLDKGKNYWLNVKVNLDRFFERIIKNNNIDCVLYENISNSFAYSAYLQCEKYGKRYMGLMGSRLPGYFEIQNSIIDKELEKIKKLSEEKPTPEELLWFERYQKEIINIQPDYMKQNGLDNVALSRLLKLNKLIKAIKLLYIGFRYNSYYDYQFGSPFKVPLKALRVNIKRYLNSKRCQNYYVNNDELALLMQKESFFVYPMHFHPESSTSVMAPEFTNEYSNIINIANNLPFGTYLYVKDHKSAKGIHEYDFYKKISSLPNVRLINYDFNIKMLILNSKGVITINSTAGYEAVLLGKPVYIFGRVFYENFINVHKVFNFKELRLIKENESSPNPLDFIAYKRYLLEGVLNINKQNSSAYYLSLVDKILLHEGI